MLATLKRLLPMAEKIVDRRSSLQILRTICLENKMARVTDLESTLVVPINNGISACLPLDLLRKLLKSKPANLQIEPSGSRLVLVHDGRRLSFKGLQTDDFPEIPSGKFNEIGKWPRELFGELLLQSRFTSTDELKPSLQGVHLVQIGNEIETQATDSHVLRFRRGLKISAGKPFEGTLPVKPLQLLARIAKGNTTVAASSDHLRFSLPGGITLYVRLLSEKYPDVASVIPKAFTGSAVVNREELLTLVNAATPFADKETNLMMLETGEGSAIMTVENQQVETKWEATLKLSEQQGGTLRIGFNLKLLERVLSLQQSPTVLWQFTNQSSASMFTEIGEQWESGAQTIIMPIRLKMEKTHENEKRDHRQTAAA
ncbi:MAG: hypothetical protein IIA59_11985 [Candidatus Marinimicrobia bacterium]|nr:hypothetical protein [Candidatus Neomarinimicrobiota bacterium]